MHSSRPAIRCHSDYGDARLAVRAAFLPGALWFGTAIPKRQRFLTPRPGESSEVNWPGLPGLQCLTALHLRANEASVLPGHRAEPLNWAAGGGGLRSGLFVVPNSRGEGRAMLSASRRQFLQTTTTAAAVAGLGQLDFLGKLPRVSAQEARPDPKIVRFTSDIEPLVGLIEETPRARLLEEVAGRIRKGTTYREVVAALLLAGVRNIQPRPSVGFKFHAVLVVNSAHLASVAGPAKERWLPIFWALDQFKSGQAATVKESGWRMPPVDESRVPPPHLARKA